GSSGLANEGQPRRMGRFLSAAMPWREARSAVLAVSDIAKNFRREIGVTPTKFSDIWPSGNWKLGKVTRRFCRVASARSARADSSQLEEFYRFSSRWGR